MPRLVAIKTRTRRGRGRPMFRLANPTSPIDRRIAELEHDELEAQIEQRIRNRLALELDVLRRTRREDQPDTWFWAMTTAARTIRGDHP